MAAAEEGELPDLRKTSLCRAFAAGSCSRGAECNFAHGRGELRRRPAGVAPATAQAKTKLCKAAAAGSCRFGGRCRFAHGEGELVLPKEAEAEPEPEPELDPLVRAWAASAGAGPPREPREPPAKRQRKQKSERRRQKDAQWRERQERERAAAASLQKQRVCSFFLRSRCTKGDECPFLHKADGPLPPAALCKFFVAGSCRHGAACNFSHELKRHACRFLFTAGRCGDGDGCRFSHAPLTSETKAMLVARLEDVAPEEVARVPLLPEEQAAADAREHAETTAALLRAPAEESPGESLARLLGSPGTLGGGDGGGVGVGVGGEEATAALLRAPVE